MKVGIVTNCLYKTEPEYVVHTDDYKYRYCEKWGIDYLRTNDDIHPDNPPAWSKPAIMLRSIRDYDWLIWMDADAATVGMDFDVAGFLSRAPSRVVIQKDKLNWNSGVFALHNDERSIRWMDYIESQRNVPRYQYGWWEQKAIIQSFGMDEWKDIMWVPRADVGWNSYLPIYTDTDEPNAYHKGHWCLHVPGKPDVVRNDIFRKFKW